MLLPCEDNCLRSVTLDRPAMRVGRFDTLPCEIERAVVDIIEKELALQRQLECMKRDLENRCDYTMHKAFRSIDRHNTGFITNCNLSTFLKCQGVYALDSELVQIIRRIDTNGDGKLTYGEFADFIRSQALPARCASPVRVCSPCRPASSPVRCSPVRCSPVRCSPVRCSPVRYCPPPVVRCSPVRCSPVRCSPVRCSPVRCPASPVRCSPVRCSPVRVCSPCKPALQCPEENQLVDALRDFISLERELESSKTSLTLKPDFNLHDAFTIFDQTRTGTVSQCEIRDGLAAIGVFPTVDEVDLFFKRYDKNRDHRLCFQEFADAFLSSDPYYSHMLHRRPSNHRHPLYRRDDCFFADTQIEFRNMWRQHFKLEVAAEAVRQRLNCNPHFDAYSAFNTLDLNSDGRIDACEIKRIIESRGFYVSQKEANSVLKKFDSHNTGAVYVREFKEEIEPKSPCKHH